MPARQLTARQQVRIGKVIAKRYPRAVTLAMSRQEYNALIESIAIELFGPRVCGAVESTGIACTLHAGHDGWHFAEVSDGSGIVEWRL